MNDTICAIATPPGEGAIALIRVSGRRSIPIVSSIFEGKKSLNSVKNRDILYGWIKNPSTGELIDEVLLFVMRGPRTYTGEDTVEISTHGGYINPRKVLEAVIMAGARPAERGEFTRRAFTNGRMDLLKAESILEIVRAKTEKGRFFAEKILSGSLSKYITKIKKKILDVATLLEVSLDFREEDVILPEKEEINKKLQTLLSELDTLKKSFTEGKILKDGIDIPIVGRPNVGKSSLFNAMLKEEKAIVTSFPGTTRDILEGWLDIGGYPVRILDTAGMHYPENEVERIGIERAEKLIGNAEFVILVIDISEPLKKDDRDLLNKFKNRVLVLNKSDLEHKMKEKDLLNEGVFVSSKEFTGFEDIDRTLIKKIESLMPVSSDLIIMNERQVNHIESAMSLIKRAMDGVREGLG
ncbi:MAG TPA: tRNA uridine-5-carboxymethylaminomethyl(34) synthesis GTPase MnmE, partial [candidate division WOR-3 bacterium]|nr:tRNA uridine-5-carboxymethylaminomethyl(34) synthesis GTPase MnmE [candidate division WOR-3 bacterium]